ncbi:hypothetical protein EB796_024128 [Bugula neritina]|uniref:Uncharacterized protein n=1 Tax=Bugula neritina TaxID=10212 RepID=A0A7J7IVF9_BUGNE|nr:hypothetical protein EB796_024128 [Bugula neritina]
MYVAQNKTTRSLFEILTLPEIELHILLQRRQLDGRGVDTFVFGDDVNSQSGFTSKSAFLINPAYPPVYKGKVTLETGIKTEKWWDCHYIPALDATVTAEWYFTDSDDWIPSTGKNDPMPVMLKVKGRVGDIRDIDHTYTFNSFRPFLTDSQASFFQVPARTVCPHLKNFDGGGSKRHEFPPIAQRGYFSFTAELVQQTSQGVGIFTDIKEYYDSQLMLSRFDYSPKGTLLGFATDAASRPISEVHDFLTGVAYVMDMELGNCTVLPLSKSPHYDVAPTDANHVRMKTVKEFFGTDGKIGAMDWTYTGQRKIRDIMADVYVSQRVGFPYGSPNNVTSTWEIAFTSSTYLDVTSSTSSVELMEPMRLWVTVPSLGYTVTYNIFDFNEEEPDKWTYDVATCFSDDQKSNVHFYIKGDQSELIERNRKEFQYRLFSSLVDSLGVSPIRLSNLDWQKSDNDDTIRVSFQILDAPTIKGSTDYIQSKSFLIPSSEAITALDKDVTQGAFVVKSDVLSSEQLKPVLAIPNSILHHKNNTIIRYINNTVTVTKNVTVEHTVVKEIAKDVVKLDAGAATGVALGSFVAGIGLGVLIIFLVNKFRKPKISSNHSLSFYPSTYDGDS